MQIRLAVFLTVIFLPLSFALAQTAASLDSIPERMHDVIIANEVPGAVTVVATRDSVLRHEERRRINHDDSAVQFQERRRHTGQVGLPEGRTGVNRKAGKLGGPRTEETRKEASDTSVVRQAD